MLKFIRKWLKFFRILLLDVDYTSDRWRQDCDHAWRYRHTMFASPKVIHLMEQAVKEHLNKQMFTSRLRSDFIRGKVKLPDTAHFDELARISYAPYVRTGKMCESWKTYPPD